MTKLLAGVDEAGRGCVLGPMIMALCTISEDQNKYFKDLGVKDSKLVPKKKRAELFEIIKKEVKEYKIIVVPAEELNVLMNRYSLNEIEAQKTAEMISLLKIRPDDIILDSPDTIESKYKQRIIDNLRNIKFDLGKSKVISEHKADLNYICAGCASILAKVTRDTLMNSLVGFELSGYSSDPKTIDYLKKYILEHKKIPDFARSKWETINNVMKELYQKKLGWFSDTKEKK